MSVASVLLPLLGLLGLSNWGRSTSAQAQFPAANANRRRAAALDDPKTRAAVNAAITRNLREQVSTDMPTSTMAESTPIGPGDSSPTGPSSPAAKLIKAVKARNAKREKAQTPKTAAALKKIKAIGKKPPAKPAPKPAAAPSSSKDADAKKAAVDLRSFLQFTKRFGTKKDRPQEVMDAQRRMGLKPDGIVGPSTRARAKQLGVTLPTR